MRLIDADALIPLIQEEKIEGEILSIAKALGDGLQAETLNQACDRHIRIINSSPTIDAVPVVRCKDCRYSDDYYNDGSCYCKHPEQGMRYIGTNWNWYCADGEREDEP